MLLNFLMAKKNNNNILLQLSIFIGEVFFFFHQIEKLMGQDFLLAYASNMINIHIL